MPKWVSRYLASVRQMVEEADASRDPQVKVVAVRVLELQAITIRELELDHRADSLVP